MQKQEHKYEVRVKRHVGSQELARHAKASGGEGFVARCIELSGCLTGGKTEAEALRNIQDAIELYLEDVEAEAKAKKAKLVQVTA